MSMHRRSLLRASAALAVSLVTAPGLARVMTPAYQPGRDIYLDHLHTTEHIGLIFAVGARYVDPALDQLNHFLRDHYTQEVGVMDPQLYDILHALHRELGARKPYEVISGYRSPKTNEHLRVSRGGGVAPRSLHMDGKAMDVRLPGVPLDQLRDAAVAMQFGGVGYYPRDQFVHLDTGRVRTWGQN